MNSLSTTSMIVIVANLGTAIISISLMLLVFWQNPRHRVNQTFAFTMLALASFNFINILGRLIDPFKLDPAPVFYSSNTAYALFIMGMFYFATTFTQANSRLAYWLNFFVWVAIPLTTFLMWGGYSDNGFVQANDNSGDYATRYTAIGYLIFVLTFLALIATTILFYQNRKNSPHGRTLWLAPAAVVVGVIWIFLLWRITRIPMNTFALAFNAFILGRAVLMDQIFDPLTRLSNELRIKNRELEETNRLKSQFMANISHELRTPLNSIIGYTDLVTHGVYGDLNDKQQDRLDKVLRNGKHLLGLINDILDISRIQAGQMALTPETVETVNLIEEVLTVLTPQIQEKNLKIIGEFHQAPPMFVDKTRAYQILLNIIGNAVKFTHKGAIRIMAEAQGNDVYFEIEDTGIGIPADKQDIVFEQFRQVDSTSTRQYGGTGLGMPITKRLVELSSGSIWLKSQLHVGTTFYVKLPQRTPLLSSTTQSANHQTKILVIDDSLDVQLMLRDIITHAHPEFEVYIANSGREGLRRAKELQPSLITLDIMMPSMDGWQVLQALQRDASLATIPVVIISAIDNHDLAARFGAATVLTKPIDQTTLLNTLANLVVVY
ncbi:MAG: response regulator [Anaerolineales bacterium]|nr:response regulator [Anaerolineales bacterium]